MKNTLSKKSIVLLSGGLDSSTVAYYVVKKSLPHLHHRVYTLTFDYGQRHKKELCNAYKISKKISAVDHKIVKFDLSLWGASALTDLNTTLPQGRRLFAKKETLINKSIPCTYVPARNTIFLSFALSYAEAIGADEIYIGVNSIDYSGYVDCRLAFIKKFQELVKVATVAGVRGKVIKIKTPLINMTKAEIIKLGYKLDVDWKNTWSCYFGKRVACGLCDSCQLRLKGFSLARIKDPILYKSYPEFYKKFLMTMN